MDNVYPKMTFGEETSETLDANVSDIPED